VTGGRRVAVAFAAVTAAAGACSDPVADRLPGVLVISAEQTAAWVRNFNPLHPAGLGRWPSRGGVYEPLLVWNTMRGAYEPWLATAWAWSDDARTLTMTVRSGVRWSDGQPFTVADVVYTFDLLRRYPAFDLDAVWGFLTAVEPDGADRVVFRFARPYIPGLHYIGQQVIVAEHVWREVADPVTWANPSPVATGPFTVVEQFEPQIYQLGRNPYYWRGPTGVASLRFPALATNEQATLAILSGEIDWAGNFIPAIDRIYVGRNPAHHRYWFPLIDSMIALYPNAARPPFDDVRVRKALSLALDRERIVRVAMYGYTRPADPTGLDDSFASWRMPVAPADDWVHHDEAAAARLLDEAGCVRPPGGGVRRCASGPLALTIETVAGWSDWVRAAQVIARNLERVGVEARVRTYDYTVWFDHLQRGDYTLSIAWTESGPTPYVFYRALLASDQVRPLGEAASRNWERLGDREADAALAAYEATTDPDEQRRLIEVLERRFVATAPIIPLFPSPSWAEFNTARFTGFPDAEHPDARATPNKPPETLLVLTRLTPRPDPRSGAPRAETPSPSRGP